MLNIPLEMAQVFDAVADCLNLLLWLQEKMKSMLIHTLQNQVTKHASVRFQLFNCDPKVVYLLYVFLQADDKQSCNSVYEIFDIFYFCSTYLSIHF